MSAVAVRPGKGAATLPIPARGPPLGGAGWGGTKVGRLCGKNIPAKEAVLRMAICDSMPSCATATVGGFPAAGGPTGVARWRMTRSTGHWPGLL